MHAEALARYKPIEYPKTPWKIFADATEVLLAKPAENATLFFALFFSFIFVARFIDMCAHDAKKNNNLPQVQVFS